MISVATVANAFVGNGVASRPQTRRRLRAYRKRLRAKGAHTHPICIWAGPYGPRAHMESELRKIGQSLASCSAQI